jgi:predicted alpha/beta superfamily hydrolase
MVTSTRPLGPAAAYSLPHAQDFTVTSELGDQFRISVGLPISYDVTDQSYPVLYVLDGDVLFGTVLEATRMRGAMGEISEAIVVGIGYPVGTDFAQYNVRRFYDFSTPDWDLTTPMGRNFAAIFEAMGQQPRLGGLVPLLDLITDQIQPAIVDQYRALADDQVLFGASAGGHLVGQALFRRPDAFRGYLAASPGFCYNDGEVFRLEEAYAESHSDLPTVVYLSAGSEETLQVANARLVSGMTQMAETLHLRTYPGLHLRCDIFAGQGHVPAVSTALHRALEFCWPGATFAMTPERARDTFHGGGRNTAPGAT